MNLPVAVTVSRFSKNCVVTRTFAGCLTFLMFDICPGGLRNGHFPARPSLWITHAAQEPWIHSHCRTGLGHWYWGQHRDLQRGQLCPAAAAALSSFPTLDAVPSLDRNPPPPRVAPGISPAH